MDQTTRSERPAGPQTLAIDVGGTRLKAGILAITGHMIAGPQRIATPHPATPDAVIDELVGMVAPLGSFERISIGFPGVVRDGRVLTAPNLGTAVWHGFPLAATLAEKLGAPARLANDATVQGLGVIAGRGVECVITLGTGMGFALFEDGRPGPHLELSQHPCARSQDLRPVHRQRGAARGWPQGVEQARAQGDRQHHHADQLRHAVYRRRQREEPAARAARDTSASSPTRPGSPAASGCGMVCSPWREALHQAFHSSSTSGSRSSLRLPSVARTRRKPRAR